MEPACRHPSAPGTDAAPPGAATTDAGGAPAPPARDAAGDASFSSFSSSSFPDLLADAGPTSAVGGVFPPPPAEGPVVRIATASGGIVVWATADGAHSTIRAAREGAGARPTGEARLVRRTSGTVQGLAVAEARGGAGEAPLGVAWASDLGERGGQLVAFAVLAADLGRVTSPVTLATLREPPQQEAHVAVAASPRGGFLVAHQGVGARCALGEEPVDCLGFDVTRVDGALRTTRAARGTLHGGPSPDFDLADLDGRALLAYATSMRGGRTQAAVVASYVEGAPPPSVDVPACGGLAAVRPTLARGTHGEVVMVCVDGASAKERCARPLRGDDRAQCLRLAASDASGRALGPPGGQATVIRAHCTAGGGVRFETPTFAVDVATTLPEELAAFVERCAPSAP